MLWAPGFYLFLFWKGTPFLFLLLSTAVTAQIPQIISRWTVNSRIVQTANLERKCTVQGWPLLLAHFALHIVLLMAASPQPLKAGSQWKHWEACTAQGAQEPFSLSHISPHLQTCLHQTSASPCFFVPSRPHSPEEVDLLPHRAAVFAHQYFQECPYCTATGNAEWKYLEPYC